MWIVLDSHKPTSAKTVPILVATNCFMYDLVYMTDNEEYFVSTDHKRVYAMDEVLYWDMVEIPDMTYFKKN